MADRHVQWVCVLAAVCLFGSQFSEFTEGRRAVLGITQKKLQCACPQVTPQRLHKQSMVKTSRDTSHPTPSPPMTLHGTRFLLSCYPNNNNKNFPVSTLNEGGVRATSAYPMRLNTD